MRVSVLVEAAARAESSFVQRGCHVISFPKMRFQPPDSLRMRILPRRDAHDVAKCALQLIGAHFFGRAERGKREPLGRAARVKIKIQLGIDLAAYSRHRLDSWIEDISGARPASATGAEAVLLGSAGSLEEIHLFSSRLARSARRPAVNARRTNRVHKLSVRFSIAALHRAPERVLDGGRGPARRIILLRLFSSPRFHNVNLQNSGALSYPILASNFRFPIGNFGVAVNRRAFADVL